MVILILALTMGKLYSLTSNTLLEHLLFWKGSFGEQALIAALKETFQPASYYHNVCNMCK